MLISQLRPRDKVLAHNTMTGKNQAETVAAVLIHHDRDLYDLTIRTTHGTEVIHTTRSHLFWVPAISRWVKAARLGHGISLGTAHANVAGVLAGHAPAPTTGWMWDITVTGDHDFYVAAGSAAVLAHNCSPGPGLGGAPAEINGFTQHGLDQVMGRDGVGVADAAIQDAVANPVQVVPQDNFTFMFTGSNATVILNSDGKVVTAWANNSAGWRNAP